jgi:phage-related minor tail protein
MNDEVTVSIEVDTKPFEAALANLQDLSSRFGSELTGALRSAAVSGKSLDDILRRIGLNLAGLALQQGLQPLRSLGSSLFSSLLGGLANITGFAKGGTTGGVIPFAGGGVVSAPTYFPMGRRLGVAGEAGPEAILPLKRGADGRLGVAAGEGGGPVNIVFNVTTPDAASFRKSEAQIAGMLARAVSRGARTL